MWASNTMICMPERESLTMNSQLSTLTTIMQRQPTQTKLWFSSDFSTEEMRNTQGSAHECSPEICPQTYVAIQNFDIFCFCYSLAANSLATHSWLLQNTATATKFSNIFSISGRVCFLILIFFFFLDYLTTILHTYATRSKIQYTRQFNEAQKWGKQEILKLQKTVSTESPFEILEQHDDHAHSDATFHEKLGLLEGRKTWVLY